jgi:hypothetical protein
VNDRATIVPCLTQGLQEDLGALTAGDGQPEAATIDYGAAKAALVNLTKST